MSAIKTVPYIAHGGKIVNIPVFVGEFLKLFNKEIAAEVVLQPESVKRFGHVDFPGGSKGFMVYKETGETFFIYHEGTKATPLIWKLL